MADIEGIAADLVAEQNDLDAVIARLDTRDWERPTPAEGWTVRDQIGHLTFFDAAAVRALTAPDGFRAEVEATLAEGPDFTERHLDRARSMSHRQLLESWQVGRGELVGAVRNADPTARVPWYGPPMSLASFASARLMEAWAHGQDVIDALAVTRLPTDRLRHIANIGVRSRAFSYTVRGLEPPTDPVRVDLTSPSGERWVWGEVASAGLVEASALGFCLVVTQRRHLADTDVVVRGGEARRWMEIAQAFAGPPGPGRQPGQFSGTG